MRSHIEIAQDAIDLVMPAISKLFERTNRQELHIVIMDPRVKPWEASFEEAILYQASLGNPNQWTTPFDDFARNKARQAWRSSTSNIVAQTLHTSSLSDDDLLFYGSFTYGDVVVACSGVQQWYDMLISGWIALAFEQICMNEYQTSKSSNPTKTLRTTR
ncbi:hypothetical protein [Vibrio panuliri]|uniref:Uncharacterized protein n=1 Tax=Vibrio panuliri TaxID=1381081 RepID=A0A1Q9HRH5_9VIBR|nr:hypothetical protein [Vibrio panuliri]KAB1457085.1 hypothetical protein F7O85_04820 [Vibrio panuliri]OLQ85200.1 hypothetical protein BIY20_16325 [Vibrio panuliri]OLQ93469.1 hypothetical protein BIY22_02975 [Vibrio panuliri]